MTPAQKINAIKFKKAIAIRKKTGCSLKQAFAEVYGKKKSVPAKKLAKKKVGKKTVKKKIVKKVSGVRKPVKKKAIKKTAKHIDTRSHNVNIRVMSGIEKIGSYHINPFTMAQIKKINPLYFQSGWEKWFGVKGKKLIISHKLQCQVYLEKISKKYLGIHYTARNVSAAGKLGDLKRFDDINDLDRHLDKHVTF